MPEKRRFLTDFGSSETGLAPTPRAIGRPAGRRHRRRGPRSRIDFDVLSASSNRAWVTDVGSAVQSGEFGKKIPFRSVRNDDDVELAIVEARAGSHPHSPSEVLSVRDRGKCERPLEEKITIDANRYRFASIAREGSERSQQK